MTGSPNSANETLSRALRNKSAEIERREVAYWVLREAGSLFPEGRLGTVLDVGGGTGAYLSLLKSQFVIENMVLADPADGRGGEDPSVVYHPINAENLSDRIPAKSVDLVLMIEVLEHLTDPDSAIAQVYQCLRPGGSLILTTPNLSSFLNRMALLLGFVPISAEVSTRKVFGRPGTTVAGHLRLHTYRSLMEFLEFYQFTISRSYTVANTWEMYRTAGRAGSPLLWMDRLAVKASPRLGSRIVVAAQRKPG